MKTDIQKIDSGEDTIIIRYKELTPEIERIIGILEKTEYGERQRAEV